MKQPQFYSIITDCVDSNAHARQHIHGSILFPGIAPILTEVHDVVALAGNIIDMVSVAKHADGQGIIIGNRAPREHVQEKYENGAPFVYAYYENILLVVTCSEELHVILQEFLGIDTWYEPSSEMLADIHTTYSIDPTTQFRSLFYAPCLAHYVLHNKDKKGDVLQTNEELPSFSPWTVWHVDNFGNLKTLATMDDYEKQELAINGAHIPLVERLKDAPDNNLAVIEGSSGIEGKKFLEVIVQGGSAAERLHKGIRDDLAR